MSDKAMLVVEPHSGEQTLHDRHLLTAYHGLLQIRPISLARILCRLHASESAASPQLVHRPRRELIGASHLYDGDYITSIWLSMCDDFRLNWTSVPSRWTWLRSLTMPVFAPISFNTSKYSTGVWAADDMGGKITAIAFKKTRACLEKMLS